jgi:hypothetical protein
VVLEALLAAGGTAFRVRYDGGCDEGFAYPEALLFGEESRPVAEVVRERATEELIGRIREAPGRESMWGNAGDMYAAASPVEAVTYALDELGTELATMLLVRDGGGGAVRCLHRGPADGRDRRRS